MAAACVAAVPARRRCRRRAAGCRRARPRWRSGTPAPAPAGRPSRRRPAPRGAGPAGRRRRPRRPPRAAGAPRWTTCPPSSGHVRHLEAERRRPSPAAASTLPRRRRPKWKSSPTTTTRAPSAPTSTCRTKSSGSSCDRASSKRRTTVWSTPGRGQDLQLLVEVGEQLGGRLRADDGGGVAVEGEHDRGQAAVRRQPAQVADDELVAPVDAVVGADGDRGAGARRRRTSPGRSPRPSGAG